MNDTNLKFTHCVCCTDWRLLLWSDAFLCATRRRRRRRDTKTTHRPVVVKAKSGPKPKVMTGCWGQCCQNKRKN